MGTQRINSQLLHSSVKTSSLDMLNATARRTATFPKFAAKRRAYVPWTAPALTIFSSLRNSVPHCGSLEACTTGSREKREETLRNIVITTPFSFGMPTLAKLASSTSILVSLRQFSCQGKHREAPWFSGANHQWKSDDAKFPQHQNTTGWGMT